MARTDEQYRKLLRSLMPKGSAWNTEGSSILQKILHALGGELARIEGRAENLHEERDLNTTTELLAEHEEDFGLPLEGDSLQETTQGRRDELKTALLKIGQQYKEYFIDIAEALGYTIEIEYFIPLWSGIGLAGDPCGDQINLFVWRVLIDLDDVTESAEVNITKLIQRIEETKPAHTTVLYEFEGAEFSRAFSSAFDRIPYYDNSWLNGEFGREFDSSFANAYDYDGVALTGAFGKDFDISYDRNSGGDYSEEFSDAFTKQK